MYSIYGTTDGEQPETVTDAPTDNIPPQNYVTRSEIEVKPPKRLDDFVR
jgi:hypothetical protein